jgi:hypothetical protein
MASKQPHRNNGIIKKRCEDWLYRTLRLKHKKWTEEETERTKKLLQKGCQVWKIAQNLGRPDVFVRRNLKIHEELRGLLRPVKTGTWSKEEAEYLMLLRIQGLNN